MKLVAAAVLLVALAACGSRTDTSDDEPVTTFDTVGSCVAGTDADGNPC